MQVINWQNFINGAAALNNQQISEKKTSITIGVFDGIHRGHQELIKKIVSYNSNYIPAIVTFRQNHKTELKDIQSFHERLDMFNEHGIKMAIVVDFTEEFKKMRGTEFLEMLYNSANPGFLAIGKNFRCGCNLDTDAAAIKNFFCTRGIPVEIVPEVTEGSLPISSSRIRAAINGGDLALAQAMLGRPL